MAQVRIRLANGHKIVAPAEVWIWAIFEGLSDQQAQKVCEKLLGLARHRQEEAQRIIDEIAGGGKPAIIVENN